MPGNLHNILFSKYIFDKWEIQVGNGRDLGERPLPSENDYQILQCNHEYVWFAVQPGKKLPTAQGRRVCTGSKLPTVQGVHPGDKLPTAVCPSRSQCRAEGSTQVQSHLQKMSKGSIQVTGDQQSTA